MRFLADESCDFIVVRALRGSGHDVIAVAEVSPGATDAEVLALARSEVRVLLTEDKDFGVLAHAADEQRTGVILIRFPSHTRTQLGEAVLNVVREIGNRIERAFIVIEPGRARISKPQS